MKVQEALIFYPTGCVVFVPELEKLAMVAVCSSEVILDLTHVRSIVPKQGLSQGWPLHKSLGRPNRLHTKSVKLITRSKTGSALS